MTLHNHKKKNDYLFVSALISLQLPYNGGQRAQIGLQVKQSTCNEVILSYETVIPPFQGFISLRYVACFHSIQAVFKGLLIKTKAS